MLYYSSIFRIVLRASRMGCAALIGFGDERVVLDVGFDVRVWIPVL